MLLLTSKLFRVFLEDDCLSYYEFESFEDAYRRVMEFMQFYDHERMHSITRYQPPYQYYESILSNSKLALDLVD